MSPITLTRTDRPVVAAHPPPPPPQTVGAKPGLACAAYFGYMKGVKNALAMKHVPYVAPRNDTKAGAGAAGCGW